MNQKVLLTGVFDNVGQNTLKQLIMCDHDVTCFDLLLTVIPDYKST